MCQGKRQICRGDCREERVEVDTLLANWDPGGVWAWAAAKDHDLVCGPDGAVGVRVDVHGSCGHPQSVPLPGTNLMSKGCAPTGIPVPPPRTMVMSNPDCCQGPCLSPWH